MTREIAYLDRCFGVWILLSSSFLTQQWWPMTVPILVEDFGTVVRSMGSGFSFSSSTISRCCPPFAFLLSLAAADSAPGLRLALYQVC